jgi:citrate lyase subunit beta/citryl-CoA lyase
MVRLSRRSYLYIPGDQPAKLERAAVVGDDDLIVDFEDGVAASALFVAPNNMAVWIHDSGVDSGPYEFPPEIWVRINPFDSPEHGAMNADLGAAITPRLTGICLAKCQSVEEVLKLSELLLDAEYRAGLEPGTVRISALLESARGLLAAAAIAAIDRVDRMQIGEADLAADLGLSPGTDESELLTLRSQVVVASAAAGIGAPIGSVSTNFRDLDRFRTSTEQLKRQGFSGRAVIHPAQISIVNHIFTPTVEEESAARTIVEQFESAIARGEGVIVDDHGDMVDEAVVITARRVLSRIEQIRRSQ